MRKYKLDFGDNLTFFQIKELLKLLLKDIQVDLDEDKIHPNVKKHLKEIK